MRVGIKNAVIRFLKTTSLSGCKYFLSPFYLDRVVWAVWSCLCVSAGVALCAALWGRFVQEPTLLAVLDARAYTARAAAPAVALCPTPSRVAQLFAEKMSVHAHEINALPWLFDTLLRDKTLAQAQIQLLEELLIRNNVTLFNAIMEVTDACSSLVRSCRWQGREEPCDQLFHKEMTPWGACCLLPPERAIEMLGDQPKLNSQTLDLLLQCPEGFHNNCFELFTRYQGEDCESPPIPLNIGYLHIVTLTNTDVRDSTRDKLFQGKCESSFGYSRQRCIFQCSEQHCGCSRPLQTPGEWLEHVHRPCPIDKLNCLKNSKAEGQCQCPPPCQTISSYAKVESSQIQQVENTFDTIFAGANASSVMVSLRINNSGSRMLELINNETWWSLLSSLGGVFSMFLGVGAITILEVLYFLIDLLLGCCRHNQDSTSAVLPEISAPEEMLPPSAPANSPARPNIEKSGKVRQKSLRARTTTRLALRIEERPLSLLIHNSEIT